MMETYTDNELFLAAQIGALRHGCEKALELLENPDAEAIDANRVIALLHIVLGENK
jgi:hypothetical protein